MVADFLGFSSLAGDFDSDAGIDTGVWALEPINRDLDEEGSVSALDTENGGTLLKETCFWGLEFLNFCLGFAMVRMVSRN